MCGAKMSELLEAATGFASVPADVLTPLEYASFLCDTTDVWALFERFPLLWFALKNDEF